MDCSSRALWRPVALVLALLLLMPAWATTSPVALALAPAGDSRVTGAAPDVGLLPKEITGVGDLVCPGSGLCVGVGSNGEGQEYFLSGTDNGRVWAAYPLPGTTGLNSYVGGIDCLSALFCYAWGSTSGPTVWSTTTPAQGGWQTQALPGPASVSAMRCTSSAVCVAVGASGDDVETSTGVAWTTADLGSGAWTTQPLDQGYRVLGVECPSSTTCVAWGQGASYPGSSQTSPTLWTTSAALGGGWARVLPIASGSGYSYTVKSVECPTVSLCVANGVSSWSSGLTSFYYSGYWVTTAPASPTSDGWEWHEGEGSHVERGPLSCLSPTVCLSWDGAQTMGSAPDPTDWAAPVPLALPAENHLKLGGFGCFAADRCYAWGTDSGAATAGPLLRTRLWSGSSLGGAWSVAPLPSPPGHADTVPNAQVVSCSAESCTAVGILRDAEGSFETLGPVVWVADSGGDWRVTAASAEVYPNLTTSGSSTRVSATVFLRGRPTPRKPTKFVGKVAAERGCARARSVSLIGRSGRPVKRLTTDRRGRFTIKLTPQVRGKLGANTRVRVAKKQKNEVICLPAKSRKVRVR